MQQDVPILEYRSPAKRERRWRLRWTAGLLALVTLMIYVLRSLELIEEHTNGNYDMSVFIGDEAASLVRPALMVLVAVWCALAMALIGGIARRFAVPTNANSSRSNA